jgi:hypothetical protein
MNSSALIRSTSAFAFAAALAACGGGGDSGTPVVKNPPAISTQPQSQSALTDATATFTVVATGSGLSYQWNRNGAAIAGATAASYTTPAATYLDSGAQYTVAVSNADGSVTSNVAQLNLALSADQQVFEALNLAPSDGSVVPRWNLNFSGAQTSGTNYAYTELAAPIVSPLTHGPQVNAQGAPQNMSSTLALATAGAVRILKNGAILVVPATLATNRISYVGSAVQVDSLAADNTTVAFTQVRSGFSFTPLTGVVSTATPPEMAHWLNSFFSNASVLKAGTLYAAGAGYMKFTAVHKGDRYNVFDCLAATTDANITPCATATTLNAALTTGMVSNSDLKTYHLADGTLTTVGGIPVWVATATRPLSATLSTTPQYRVYFQLNGNVYTGALIKDGAPATGNYWVSNPAGATVEERLTLLDYQLRLNKAARDSLVAAMAI